MSLSGKLRENKLPLLSGLACAAVLAVGRIISSKYAQLLAIVLLFLTIWFTLDRRPREGISPYALQNPNFEKMSGQLTAEDFEAAIRGGGIAPIRTTAPIARRIDDHEQEGSAGSSSSTAFSGTGYRLSSAVDSAVDDDDSAPPPPPPPADAGARAAAAARARAAAAAAARASAEGVQPHVAAAGAAAASPAAAAAAGTASYADASEHHEKVL